MDNDLSKGKITNICVFCTSSKESNPQDMETMKQIVVSVLNGSKLNEYHC